MAGRHASRPVSREACGPASKAAKLHVTLTSDLSTYKLRVLEMSTTRLCGLAPHHHHAAPALPSSQCCPGI